MCDFESEARNLGLSMKLWRTDALTLRKPRPIRGKPAFFEEYFAAGSQKERDRQLFSR